MTFGLLGVGGFVAPRHMNAIRSVGGELVAACDPKDSVGVLTAISLIVTFSPSSNALTAISTKFHGRANR
jgi:predicted dehydrogenase